MLKIMFILITIIYCSGCSHVMSDSRLKQVDSTISYKKLAAKPDSYIGKNVLLGGILENVEGGSDITTLEITQLNLFSNGVPNETYSSVGKFFAISTKLIDPVIYRPGNLVTIIGEIKGKKNISINGEEYSYPLLSIKEIRFFRPSKPFPNLHPNPYQSNVGDDRFIQTPAVLQRP